MEGINLGRRPDGGNVVCPAGAQRDLALCGKIAKGALTDLHTVAICNAARYTDATIRSEHTRPERGRKTTGPASSATPAFGPATDVSQVPRSPSCHHAGRRLCLPT